MKTERWFARGSVAVALIATACGSSAPAAREPVDNRGEVGALPAVEPAFEVVARTQAGGVIELRGERGAAMEGAAAAMKAHCPDFTIVQEGEEVIGMDTVEKADGSGVVTEQTTAWRVHYQCPSP
jgi:hypothetical protein